MHPHFDSIRTKVQSQEALTRTADWLRVLRCLAPLVEKSGKRLHQWSGLRIYTATGKDAAKFSLRFHGQEVGEILCTRESVVLKVTAKHAATNAKINATCNLWPDKTMQMPWRGSDAAAFRACFNKLRDSDMSGLRSKEHMIESCVLDLLQGPHPAEGLGRAFRNHAAVTVGGLPLQFPVPFSASAGAAERRSGHVDILVRHKINPQKTTLAVWELKAPHGTGKPLEQAYNYTCQLLALLRSQQGAEWHQCFGFSGKTLPKSITIECVAVVAKDDLGKALKELQALRTEIEAPKNGDVIKPRIACYETDRTGRVSNFWYAVEA